MDTVTFRLDGDVASTCKVNAERAGLPMSEYINELVRVTLRAGKGIQPVYIPPGRTDEATRAFQSDAQLNANKSSHVHHVARLWVFRDLVQPVVWMLPAHLENQSELHVVLRQQGGRAFAVSRDQLISWTVYTSEQERMVLMFDWYHAGATPHPWNALIFKP